MNLPVWSLLRRRDLVPPQPRRAHRSLGHHPRTVVTLLLLLLIGIGPKIALVPFLEKTKNFAPEEQRDIGRRMVKTAVVAAVIVYFTGAFLLRLLHITPGAVAVAAASSWRCSP